MGKKIKIQLSTEKKPLFILIIFIALVLGSLVILFSFVSKSVQNKNSLTESTNRLEVLQQNLSTERNKMNALKQAQEAKTGQAINLKNSLNSMLWNNSKDVKYYFYDLSKTLKVTIVAVGIENSVTGQYFTKVEYPLVISGNYNSVVEYIYMIENSDELMYIGSNNVVVEQLGNGRVQATFTVEADTR